MGFAAARFGVASLGGIGQSIDGFGPVTGPEFFSDSLGITFESFCVPAKLFEVVIHRRSMYRNCLRLPGILLA